MSPCIGTNTIELRLFPNPQHYLTRREHNINSDCVAGLSKAVGFLLSSLGLSEGTRIKGFAGFILQVLVLFLVDVK